MDAQTNPDRGPFIGANRFQSMRKVFYFWIATLSMALQACATSSDLTIARDEFRQGRPVAALETLSSADVSSRDRLLLLLDRGLVAQAAGQYPQSVTAFEAAYQLIDEWDYISTLDQSAALLSSDWAIRYAGEYSERLWIHTFQMINFLLLEQPQSAAVEARRAVKLLDTHKDVLSADFFTRYLMAISFQTAMQYDSANVEFRKLAADLVLDSEAINTRKKHKLVIVLASGFIPAKQPGDLFIDLDHRIAFPYYPAETTQPPIVEIRSHDRILDVQRIDTSMASISAQALKKRGKAIAARQALRLAAKYAIAEEIEDENEVAGAVAKLVFFLIEQADTRSWETLPAYLSLIQVPVDESMGSISIDLEHANSTYPYSTVIDVDIGRSKPHNQFVFIRLGADELITHSKSLDRKTSLLKD